MKTIWKNWLKQCQKAQMMILTAVLLPVMLTFSGLAIDIGHLYMQQVNLQDAADASITAGGWTFVDAKETPDNHPRSDSMTYEYLKENYAELGDVAVTCQARTGSDGDIYYRAVLSKDIKVYLLSILNAEKSFKVTAQACVKIHVGSQASGSTGLFSNLFTFGEYNFQAINANQNPDNPNIAQISQSATYSGNVVSTGQGRTYYSHQLMNSDSQQYTYVQQAIDAGAYTKVTVDKSVQLDSELQSFLDMGKDTNNTMQITDQNDQNPNVSYTMKKVVAQGKNAISYSIPNINFSQDSAIQGSEPLYVILDRNVNNINIQLQANMTSSDRPLVFVYAGTGQVHINGNHNDFRGVVYAPYANVMINDNDMRFKGSIAAAGIQLQSRGTYAYESILGGGTSSPSTVILTTANTNKVQWN